MLADHHNSYINDFQVYTGKIPNQPRQLSKTSQERYGYKTTMNNCDNFFSSKLFEVLLQNGSQVVQDGNIEEACQSCHLSQTERAR